MIYRLYKKHPIIIGNLELVGSKSESNRLIIFQALYPKKIKIKNLSTSDDTNLLKICLYTIKNKVYIHNAGTAMRFLTAYFACLPNKKIFITGSKRMQERPIGILVDALLNIGANISYVKTRGFPPLNIKGQYLIGGELKIKANVSSQYITALMLIGATLEKGLTLFIYEKIISPPYLDMTLNLLKKAGIQIFRKKRYIFISFLRERFIKKIIYFVESDWSSASYFYAMAAFSKKCNIRIFNFKKQSLQGDVSVVSIYERFFGVKTTFYNDKSILITKNAYHFMPKYFEYDLNKSPDLAQTIAVSCAVLRIKCLIKGLATLKIKETDRLQALKIELLKCGAKVSITKNSLEIIDLVKPFDEPMINTYNDHRMAMAFATLAMSKPILITNPKVVEKSYTSFWRDLKILGFFIETNGKY